MHDKSSDWGLATANHRITQTLPNPILQLHTQRSLQLSIPIITRVKPIPETDPSRPTRTPPTPTPTPPRNPRSKER